MKGDKGLVWQEWMMLILMLGVIFTVWLVSFFENARAMSHLRFYLHEIATKVF